MGIDERNSPVTEIGFLLNRHEPEIWVFLEILSIQILFCYDLYFNSRELKGC